MGILTDKKKLINFLGKWKYLAPFIFMFLKILVALVPFIPNSFFILIGFLLFGQIGGIFLNYLSSMATAYLNFFLTKKLGRRFVDNLSSGKSFNKYSKLISQTQKKFNKILFIFCAVPFLADNTICLLAGLTKIDFKKYLKTVALGKLIEIFLLAYISKYLTNFIHYFIK